jgi:hypothetical protein
MPPVHQTVRKNASRIAQTSYATWLCPPLCPAPWPAAATQPKTAQSRAGDRRSGGPLIVIILTPDGSRIVARVRFSSEERQHIEAALKGNWSALPDLIDRAVASFISAHEQHTQRRAA